MGDSGTLSSGRRDRENCKISEHDCGSVASVLGVCFPTGNGIFQQGNVPCQKARNVLEGFEEYKDEFLLIYWPPNSADLNLMESIWVFSERQHRDRTYCQFVSTLRDHCLDIWYNLSPVIYQEPVISMPR
ncbi:DDE_3 domain-containing protein [Trichonephila clavipes]|nr:DDE_3 domain-containing protein [Trichonephila clavipes]